MRQTLPIQVLLELCKNRYKTMVEVMVIQDKEKLISKKCALENV